VAGGPQAFTDRDQFGKQHRFSARQDRVPTVVLAHPFEDFFDRQILAFGIPRGERRVAEPASQIAAGGAQKHARRPRQEALALN